MHWLAGRLSKKKKNVGDKNYIINTTYHVNGLKARCGGGQGANVWELKGRSVALEPNSAGVVKALTSAAALLLALT